MKRIILSIAILAFLGSCKKSGDSCTASDSPLVAPAAEVTYLRNYCSTNAPTAIEHSSGIFYQILTSGSGATANICSNVTVRYAGYLLGSSTTFDASSTGVTFPLSRLIVGWQKGIPLMPKGGSIRLYIPPTLGYGANGAPPTIPPNSYLRFDINVDDVQ